MLTNNLNNVVLFPVKSKTVGEVCQEFEQDYFTCRKRTAKSQSTWDNEYGYVFKKLPQSALLTADLLIDAVKTTQPDSRNRKRFCIVLSALARFCGQWVDLKPYEGNYSHIKAAPRDLPSDDLIVEIFNQITASDWQWAFGMIAAYGLRPHELFHLDYQLVRAGEVGLNVLDGKTGERLVYPFRPEWFEEFNLAIAQPPKCNGKNNKDLGNRVAHAFQRFNIPFRAYDLRHAWAVRSMSFGLDVSLAAYQMGHSLSIHSKVYHRWISAKVHRAAYDAICQAGIIPEESQKKRLVQNP